MAIYEYYCPSCRRRFEQRRSMSQVATLVKCECGAPAEKTLSAFAVSRPGDSPEAAPMMGGGGCCGGGGCACAN
jgi:putative FmdB family regulatory protein